MNASATSTGQQPAETPPSLVIAEMRRVTVHVARPTPLLDTARIRVSQEFWSSGHPHTDLDSMILKSLGLQGQIGGNSQAVSDTRVRMVRTEWVAPTVRSRTIGARMASD